MLNYILIAHLLGATIWTGGHPILSLSILPKVLVNFDVARLLQFEQQFEKVAMPALVVQVVTGLWMAQHLIVNFSAWFALDNDLSILISIKLSLLLVTILVELHARFWVILTLSVNTLKAFSVNIILITVLAVSFVIVGSLFRIGLN